MKKRLLLFYFLLISCAGFTQQQLTGIVTDQENIPLAFVNIIVNENSQIGTMTDINGKFSLREKDIRSLSFSYIGYENLLVPIEAKSFTKALQVQLQPIDQVLATAEVIAGENPAHRIIRKVVQARAQHRPDRLSAYRCENYNKMVGMFETKERAFEEYKNAKEKLSRRDSGMIATIQFSKQQHLMMMETVTDKKYARPNKIQETIIYNKVSGFQTPEFAFLATDYQPFSFYQDYVSLYAEDYLNPISPGSTKRYFFELQDTLYQGQDSIFIIAFQPKKGKLFNGLKGLLYVHTQGYALQNVVARPAALTAAKIKIEQSYRLVDGVQWFPHELNLEILFPKYINKFTALKIKSTSRIRKVELDPIFDKKLFRQDEVVFSDSVNYTSHAKLAAYRVDSLDQQELKTYQFMDSMGQLLKLEPIMDFFLSFSTGKYPIGPIDLDVDRLVGFNNYENVRLGLGVHTNDLVSKYFSLGGYFAYGFEDKAWKYSGDFRLFFPFLDIPRLQLKVSYQNEIREPAGLEMLSLRPLLSNRYLFVDRVDQIEEKAISISGDLLKNVYTKLSLHQQIFTPLYEYEYAGDQLASNRFNFTELEFATRFAYGERFLSSNGMRTALGTRFPVLQVSYTLGLDNFLDGAYRYHRLRIALEDDFRLRNFGKIDYRLEMGYAQGDLPYPKLFNGSGVGGDFATLAIGNNFQTMFNYEFVSSRFVQLYFKYEIGNILYRMKYSQPKLSLVQNTAIGMLDNRAQHQKLVFKTMEHGFFESGIVLDNLIRLKIMSLGYLGFGGAVYYRYGAYHLAEQHENVAFRLTSGFSF